MSEPFVRPYEPCDRVGVLELCADTGLLGDPIDPLIADRRGFASMIVGPYLLFRPELASVLDVDGAVAGYSIGAVTSSFEVIGGYYSAKELAKMGLKLAFDASYRRLNAKGILQMLSTGFDQIPSHPKDVHAHLHLNLREDVRGLRYGLELLAAFEEKLRERGVGAYHGEVFTTKQRGHTRHAFERASFTIHDARENHMFDGFREHVELAMIVKTL